MKKLFAIMIATVMLLSMSITSFAADPTNLTELFAGLGVATTRSIDVPVDIQVDVGQTGTFTDGPVTKAGSSATVDYKATIYMEEVRTLYSAYMAAARFAAAGIGDLETQLGNCKVTGSFTIKITYPETAIVPDVVVQSTALSGFTGADVIFTETTPRTIVDSGDNKQLTIVIDVIGPEPARVGYVLASDMTPNLEAYLPDITLTCAGIGLNGTGEYKVTGEITGSTLIHDQNGVLISTINYTGKQGNAGGVTGTEISETVELVLDTITPILPPSPVGDKDEQTGSEDEQTGPIEITIELPNVENPEPIVIPEDEEKPTINIDKIIEEINPEREGFVFTGFYDDEYYSNKLEGEVEITENTTIHARFVNTTVPEIFDAENHIQYVHGYPDETVRPESNVSREEVATMFYRLLKEEVREGVKASENNFSDVDTDRWSNNAISTMANGGYVNGYEDGSFRPGDYITRAEFATMAYRFLGKAIDGERSFDDIDGHWAEENIKSVANNEWILGYKDGSFRPDEYITRAEAITIINRIVVRYVEEHGLVGDEKEWIDNPVDAWYYHAIIEATHEHDHVRAEDKYNEIWGKSNSEMLVD